MPHRKAGLTADNDYMQKWREGHRERSREIARIHYARNRENILRRQSTPEYLEKKNENRNRRYVPGSMKWVKLFKKYGITQEDYSAMLGEQMACCAGCGRHFEMSKPRGGGACCVDHDHLKDRPDGTCPKEAVRGLLCSDCNAAVGYARDAVSTLLRLAEYLKVRFSQVHIDKALTVW